MLPAALYRREKLMIYGILLFVILILVNLALWLFFMPWYVGRRVGRMQNDLINKHYDEVETMYRRMRGWRHDYHNHIQVLKAHMELKQYDKASEYLDMLAEDLSRVDTLIRTGNVIVDAILNSKLAMMRDRGIRVDATAFVPEDIGISGVDLSALIGNLLDNAMEACMKMPAEEERFVRIYIDIIKKQLYLSVVNSMQGAAERAGGRFLSTKNGNHGFGLFRIDSIVSKYGGYLNRQTENGVFATEVTLPVDTEVKPSSGSED